MYFFCDDDSGDDNENIVNILTTTKQQKIENSCLAKRDFFTRTGNFLVSSFFISHLAHCISMPYLSNSKFITLPSYSLVSN